MMTTSNEHNNAPAVPQGWKLVPVEPTRAMWAAVNKLDDEMAAGSYDGKGCSIEQAWNCMLDFAPDAPALAATQAPAPAQEPVTTAEVSARYRFLMALLIDRGVLTDRRYSNGTWSLQGIALVDDSGLRGAGRTPEEAIDNAIEMARLNPNDQLTKWRETHEQIEQEVGLTDEAVNDAAKVLAERFDYPWEHMPEEGRKNMRVQARAVVEAALRAKGASDA